MKYFLAFLLVTLSSTTIAQTVDETTIFDTLDKLAKRNIQEHFVKYKTDLEAFKKDIIKWNPNIKDWNNLSSGTLIYTSYPYPTYVAHSDMHTAPKDIFHYNELVQPFTLVGSITSYSAKTTDTASDKSLKFESNYPITVGLNSALTDFSKEHYLIVAINWTLTSKVDLSGDGILVKETIKTPREINTNLFYKYLHRSTLFQGYFGYEFDILNSLNTDEIVLGQSSKIYNNKLHYGTLGFGQGIYNESYMVDTTLAYSQVFSSTSSGPKKINGHKFLFNISLRPTSKISYNLFYKLFDYTGTTHYKSNRFGINLGFQLF
jgi:hypothetical protein